VASAQALPSFIDISNYKGWSHRHHRRRAGRPGLRYSEAEFLVMIKD
jgi:hypothetical protein